MNVSRVTERQRAITLKAADARDLIRSSLPFVLQQMTAAQVDQVQRVLDAARESNNSGRWTKVQ